MQITGAVIDIIKRNIQQLFDRAANNPEEVAGMVEIHHLWAELCGVLPWPKRPRLLPLKMV
tara:strand:- start:545 stop:727 length:183 start_codon:yes stop_codon:yes gene_type:complete